MSNSIKIITPFYNPGEFLEQCVSSAISQKYDNYKMIFIDDCSTDGSFDKLPHDDDRAIIIRNETRKTALENLHNAIMNCCEPEDIVVILDGDDWLSSKKVLQYIDKQYNSLDCWIMYGSASWTDGRNCFSSEYTEEDFKDLRKAPFRVSHLRTFKAGLYHKIKEQDSDFSCLKDSKGEFYKMTYDVAMMLPLLEMAGKEKVVHNKSILYIYNRENPISDDKVNQQLQWSIHAEILKKPKFKTLESYE